MSQTANCLKDSDWDYENKTLSSNQSFIMNALRNYAENIAKTDCGACLANSMFHDVSMDDFDTSEYFFNPTSKCTHILLAALKSFLQIPPDETQQLISDLEMFCVAK